MSKTQQINGLADQSLASSCSSGLNNAGTCAPADTPVTQRRSRRVRWEIVDAINRIHGPYKTLAAAIAYIGKRFRFQAQDDDRTGRYPVGWDFQIAQPRARKRRARKVAT